MSQTETATFNQWMLKSIIAELADPNSREISYSNVTKAAAEMLSAHFTEVVSIADAYDERDVE